MYRHFLYILIGPKGSGKTHIGGLIDIHTDIHFLRVEPVWLDLEPGEDGWDKVADAVDTAFQTNGKVMIESLGAGDGFRHMLDRLKSRYPTRLVKVAAAPDTCLERVRTRDGRDHIPVSDEKVAAYNRVAAQVEYPWDAVIDNEGPASSAAILSTIRAISE